MDFDFKSYQIIRCKKYFKRVGCFLILHSSKYDSSKWMRTEQELKKLRLTYYKPLNKAIVWSLNSSIYKNFGSVFSSFVLLISFTYKTTNQNFQQILKELKPAFVIVGLKLNNRIYSPAQLKGFKEFSYKKNMFNLHRVLDKSLKTSYTLTDTKNRVSK